MRIPLFLFLVIAIVSCTSNGGDDFYYIKNDAFTAIETDSSRIQKVARKELQKKFSYVSAIKVENFAQTKEEVEKLFETKAQSKIFVEPFLLPIFTHWDGKDVTTCKVISYGEEISIQTSKLPLFLMVTKKQLLDDALFNWLNRKVSSNKKALIVTMENSELPHYYEKKEFFKKELWEFQELNNSTTNKEIQSKFEEGGFYFLVLYAGFLNRIINTFEENVLDSLLIVELETEYVSEKRIGKRMSVDYEVVIKDGLNANEFKQFLIEDRTGDAVHVFSSTSSKAIKIR